MPTFCVNPLMPGPISEHSPGPQSADCPLPELRTTCKHRVTCQRRKFNGTQTLAIGADMTSSVSCRCLQSSKPFCGSSTRRAWQIRAAFSSGSLL